MDLRFARRAAAGRVLLCAVLSAAALPSLALPSPALAQVATGPDPALAGGQDRRAAGSAVPSTVYREPDGTPYVLKGPNEKQFLSGYNVTWIDKDHVIAPPGVGGFD